ncbi:MAG: VOC family protein [Pararhodobacter sp.]|nr:VOC family protein [Pararhodobacter sp.]
MLTFDHLAIAAESLDEGTAAIEQALGVRLAPGGEHAAMGTHNRLLSLGPGEYLEVIAINPAAPAPGRARWFGLDDFSGATRPQCWIARSDDMPAALAAAPQGTGIPIHFTRGAYEWEMAVPDSGILPFDGLFPALIGWHSQAHPADALPDAGVRLNRLVITHPDAAALRAALDALIHDPRIAVTTGAEPALAVELQTPNGPRLLA